MLKIGIIVGRKRADRKSLISFIKSRKIKEEIIMAGEAEIKVLTLSLKGKKLEKKIKKAEEKLRLNDCQFILKEMCLKDKKEEERQKTSEKKEFFSLAFELYREYLKILELKAYKMKLLIIDKDLISVGKAELDRICFYSASCDILTKNSEKAEELSEFIFNQNGFFVNVKRETGQSGYDVIFDIENKTLKVDGKIFIKNVDLGLENFLKFNLNPFELKENLENLGIGFAYNKTVGNTAYFKIK